jgi:hypothetical protein
LSPEKTVSLVSFGYFGAAMHSRPPNAVKRLSVTLCYFETRLNCLITELRCLRQAWSVTPGGTCFRLVGKHGLAGNAPTLSLRMNLTRNAFSCRKSGAIRGFVPKTGEKWHAFPVAAGSSA